MMQEKRECNLVKDLLPNYIEKLTSKETNQYIENHLGECKECRQVLESMKEDIKLNADKPDKRKINYVKKYSKKMKSLKIILLIIIVLLVIVIGRKAIIMASLSNKSQQLQNENQSSYMKIHSYSEGVMQTVESYSKQQDYLVTITRYSEELGKSKRIYYRRGEENLHVIENGEKKIVTKRGEASIRPISYTSEFFVENLAMAIFSSVEKISLKGKECYIIRDGNTEKFIDKETGLAIKMIDNNNNRTVDYYYEFGTVQDSDIVKPDTTGYIEK